MSTDTATSVRYFILLWERERIRRICVLLEAPGEGWGVREKRGR